MEKKYARVLENSILAPFKALNFCSQGTPIPVIYELIRVHLDRDYRHKLKFKIELSYGTHKWFVYRNLVDVLELQIFFKIKKLQKKHNPSLELAGTGAVDKVENFLRTVLSTVGYRDYKEVLVFFAISKYSFFGERMYEDMFHVNIEDFNTYKLACSPCINRKVVRKMYVLVKKECVIFIEEINSQSIDFVFLYDSNTEVLYKPRIFRKAVKLMNLKEKVTIESAHVERARELYDCIMVCLQRSTYRNHNRYNSFAPIRKDTPVQYMVDAKTYYKHLYSSFKASKDEIFIAGWWVFPKVFLKRRFKNGKLMKKYRLDYVLKKKAEEGVRIYVLLYREFEMALPINSMYTMTKLTSLNRNIQVVRHPTFLSEGLIYWSHHEKIVVVDQKIGYVGGIDICLGRYDDTHHYLFDEKHPLDEHRHIGKTKATRKRKEKELLGEEEKQEVDMWPGSDFSNPLKKDFVDVSSTVDDLIDRKSTPRMPWHDIHCQVGGHVAKDLSHHFIERWNYSKLISSDRNIDFILPFSGDSQRHAALGDYCAQAQLVRSIGQWSNRGITERSIYFAYKDLISNARSFLYIENQFFITRCCDGDGDVPENDLGVVLVERIRKAHISRKPFKAYILIPHLPAFEAELETSRSSMREIIRIQTESISKGKKSLFSVLESQGICPEDYVLFLSLRTGSIDPKRLTSELVYVHSKLIVSDLDRCIIGSANFNDRSMCGNRDSEVAILVEDSETGFVKNLLKSLLKEHLGLMEGAEESFTELGDEKEASLLLREAFLKNGWESLECDGLFAAIRLRAEVNTKMYKQLYRVVPDNDIRSREDLKEFKKVQGIVKQSQDPNLVEECSKRIQGNLVLYPTHFLTEETGYNVFGIDELIPEVIYY